MTHLPTVVARRLARPQRGDPFRAQQLTVAATGVVGAALAVLVVSDHLVAGAVVAAVVVGLALALRGPLAVAVARSRQVRAAEGRVFATLGRPTQALAFHRRQRVAADVLTTLLTVALIVVGLLTASGLFDHDRLWPLVLAGVAGTLLGLALGEGLWCAALRARSGERSGEAALRWRSGHGHG